jgi:hypothetical protein
MEIDTSNWSGEGTFTQVLIDRLREVDEIAALRVEDAPSTRSDADYNFISNEIFVTFRVRRRREPRRWLGVLPAIRFVEEPAMTIGALAVALGEREGVGPADFVDEAMIQYLQTERIIPPYQTRGFKLVEMVRIYGAGTVPRP